MANLYISLLSENLYMLPVIDIYILISRTIQFQLLNDRPKTSDHNNS